MLERRVVICDAKSGDKMYEATLDYDLSGNVKMTDPLYFRSEVIRQLKFLGHCFFNAVSKLADARAVWMCNSKLISWAELTMALHKTAMTMAQCYATAVSFHLKGDGGQVSAEDFKSYFIEHSQMEFTGKSELIEQFMAAVESNSVTEAQLRHILRHSVVKEAA